MNLIDELMKWLSNLKLRDFSTIKEILIEYKNRTSVKLNVC